MLLLLCSLSLHIKSDCNTARKRRANAAAIRFVSQRPFRLQYGVDGDAMKTKGDTPETLKKFGMAMSLGTLFISYVAAGGILGYYLDKWLDTGNTMFLICFPLGIAGAIYNLFKIAARLN
jgi:hypothetical protein